MRPSTIHSRPSPFSLLLAALAVLGLAGCIEESTVVKVKKAGWTGHEVIYAFEDINKIKLDMNMKSAGDMEQGGEEGGDAADKEAARANLVAFELKDGVLKIMTPDLAETGESDGEEASDGEDGAEGAADPFEGEAGGAQIAAMMAPMLAGTKVGFFVEIDGEIAGTNAHHQNGNLLTLMSMDQPVVGGDGADLGEAARRTRAPAMAT